MNNIVVLQILFFIVSIFALNIIPQAIHASWYNLLYFLTTSIIGLSLSCIIPLWVNGTDIAKTIKHIFNQVCRHVKFYTLLITITLILIFISKGIIGYFILY